MKFECFLPLICLNPLIFYYCSVQKFVQCSKCRKCSVPNFVPGSKCWTCSVHNFVHCSLWHIQMSCTKSLLPWFSSRPGVYKACSAWKSLFLTSLKHFAERMDFKKASSDWQIIRFLASKILQASLQSSDLNWTNWGSSFQSDWLIFCHFASRRSFSRINLSWIKAIYPWYSNIMLYL